jgi:ribonuclease BN (tRNA processing enzyme)
MALKILTSIGTDLGITSNAYIRISDYQINKPAASATFRIEIHQSQPAEGESIGFGTSARNQQIGEALYVSFMKPVEKTVTGTRIIYVGDTPEDKQPVEQSYTETVIVPELDLSEAEATNIFAFGYAKLKEKLQGLFGAGNVVDC